MVKTSCYPVKRCYFSLKNMKKQQKTDYFLITPNPHFSAELFSDTRLRQGVPAGVLTYVEDCSAAVQRSSREKKPLKSPRGETLVSSENPRHFHYPLFVKTNPFSRTQESPQILAVVSLTAIYTPKITKKTNPNEPKTNPNSKRPK